MGAPEETWKYRDAEGRPVVRNMRKRIGDLRYRLEHLEEMYDPTRKGPGSMRMHAEMLSLRAAIAVMEYHRMELEGDDSVLLVLAELADAVAEEAEVSPRVQAALKRARAVLSEL